MGQSLVVDSRARSQEEREPSLLCGLPKTALRHQGLVPLPRIDDTLDTLAGAKWFSTMDLKSGFW